MILRPLSSLHRASLRVLATALILVAGYACGGGSEQAGQACEAPKDCYPDIDAAKIKGTVLCLDRVPEGYCTHLCETDADCCAVQGECRGNHPQLCAPFESTGMKMCFLSCESDAIGDQAEGAYCQEFAGDAFGCRSTGGGTENRKICSP